jgi:hypothetical protein
MAIFIEGCDLAGKTMYGKKLAAELGWPHEIKRCRGCNMTLQLLDQARIIRSVVDRWWPSEWVYRTAEGAIPAINPCEMWAMNLMAARSGSVYVQLEPDPDTVAKRYAARGETLELPIVQIINGHYQLHNKTWWKFLPDEPMINPKRDDVVQRARQNLKLAAAYPGQGIGSLQPEILIVGASANPRANTRDDEPFITVHHRGASRVLFHILNGCGYTPSQIHLHNAYSQKGKALLTAETIRFLNPFKIIALGEDAAQYMVELGNYPFYLFTHPTWIFKNDYKNLNRYTGALQELLLLGEAYEHPDANAKE